MGPGCRKSGSANGSPLGILISVAIGTDGWSNPTFRLRIREFCGATQTFIAGAYGYRLALPISRRWCAQSVRQKSQPRRGSAHRLRSYPKFVAGEHQRCVSTESISGAVAPSGISQIFISSQ